MFLTALTFFIILTILVLVHELGHFIVARAIGVRVDEFGLGLPPRIFGKKWKGILWSVNWLPLGGFVKLAGEDAEYGSGRAGRWSIGSGKTEKGVALKEHFWARSKKERAAILTAGVIMNFLLAYALTAYLLTQGVQEPSGRVHVERVLPESPAEKAKVKEGDIIQAISCAPKTPSCGELAVRVPKDVIDFTKKHLGESVTVTLVRDGKTLMITLVPRKEYPKGQGPMGVAVSDLELHIYPASVAITKGLEITLVRGKDMLVGIGSLLWRFVSFQPVSGDVAGPIGIAQVTGQAVKFGWKAVIEFMSILSLNLAVLNILPIPALDGGRLAFVFLEKLIGKRIRPAFERSTHQVGMLILFALILLISINDIMRLARGG